MQILSLALTIIGAILALIGALIGNIVVGVIGTFLTILGAVFQYLIGKPFIKNFTEDDWAGSRDEYSLSISARRHWRGHGVSATVYQSSDESYEVVECDEVEQRDGSFLIRASKPFRGRLVLR